MARLLVVGSTQHLASRALLDRLVEQARQDGHDAGPCVRAKDVADADGLVALLDGADAVTAAAMALAHAEGKPVLGLASGSPDAMLADLCNVKNVRDEASCLAALAPFYEAVRPFAGRVVRDRIPELVREAGHSVAFHEVTGEDRPRFLKQKVAAEAHELLRADIGEEKEEIADVLEALESFIVSRGFDRDDLKRIKEAKRKRRGGFSKVYVVESTSSPERGEPAEPAKPEEAPKGQTLFDV